MENRRNTTLSSIKAKDEIRIVVEHILRYHPNPFHVTSKNEFYSTIDETLAHQGDVSLPQHFFTLARIASLVFDTHTQIHVTKETPGFDASFPLRFRIFRDGLYIIAGNKAYRDAIGKKLISISGHNPDDVLNKLCHYAFSDHVERKRVFCEIFLYMPETYDVFNFKTAGGKIELVVQDQDGRQSTLELSETWNKGYADFSWDRLNPFIPKGLHTIHEVWQTPVPFYQQHIDDNYWYQFLDGDKRCMYIQINKQFDKEDKHSIEFHLEWTKAFWEAKPENIIVDLRNNPGGMTNVGSGIPAFLENAYFTQPGLKGVAVLFGLDTVSAGTILIAQLECTVEPVMIGEPTGSSPNMNLNAHEIILPYSKLQSEVSQTRFISAIEADPRTYIAPDIPISGTFGDYANGRDPVIDVAKFVTREQHDEFYTDSSYRAPWLRKSQREQPSR